MRSEQHEEADSGYLADGPERAGCFAGANVPVDGRGIKRTRRPPAGFLIRRLG